jgi:hypothetical protein
MKTKRITRIFAVIILFLTGVGGVLIFVDLPAPGLGKAIAERAKRDLGVELRGGHFGINLLHGLVLEDAEAITSTEGRSYRLSIPRMRFVHHPRALLSGAFEVQRILFEAPVLELIEGADPTGEEPSEAAPGSGSPWLSFAIEEVDMDDASITWSDDGTDVPSTKLQGVEIRLRELELLEDEALRGTILAVEGSGDFSAGRSSFGDIEVTGAHAKLYLNEGSASLTLLNFETAFAPFVAEMRVVLQKAPFDYTVSSLGEPFQLGPLLGAAPDALDEASLLLEVFGRGPTAEGFRAQGSVTLPADELVPVPALTAVNEHLGREVFRVGEDYQETIAVIRVRDGYVLFQPFDLVTDRVVTTFRGRAYLNGELEMELVVHDDVSGEEGTLLRLRGTVDQPVIE